MVRKKQKKINPSVFSSYLHSHLLVFLLPLFLCLALFAFYSHLYKTEIVNNHYEQSRHLALTIDTYMEQVQNVVLMVNTDSTLTHARMEDSMNQIRATKTLHTIMLSSPLVDELYYYQRNLDKALSSRVVMELSSIEQFHLQYPQWPTEYMLSDIYENPRHSWRPFEYVIRSTQKNAEIMTGIYPLTQSDQYNASVLMVQIEKSQFERLMGIDHLVSGSFSIYTADGLCLYEYGDIPSLPKDLKTTGFSSSPYSYEEDGQLINVFASSYNGWYYVHSFPVRSALDKLLQVQIILFVFMLLSLPLGYLITYAMAKRNYRPVRELQSLINSKDLDAIPVQDEIAQAKYAITYLNDLKDSLEDRLDISNTHAREGLLLGLLKGHFSSIEEFNAKGVSCGIVLKGQMIFAVAIARENDEWSEKQFMSLLQSNRYDCHLLGLPGEMYRIYLCAVEHYQQSQIPADFSRFAQTMQEACGSPICMGISQPTTDVTNGYRCCVESLVAMGHARSANESMVVFSRDEYRYTLHHPSSELALLSQSIKERNLVQFTDIYNLLYEYISNLDSASLVRPCVGFEVINILLRALLEYNKDVFPLDLLERYAEHSLHGTAGNPETLFEIMDMLYQQLCTLWQEETEKPVDPIERIKRFIEQHYCDPDFSVAMIADSEGMRLSALSTYFKKETKMTLSQYIDTKKMNFITNLLRQSDLPLNEIANAAGYTSTSSFIRKFRQYMGVTPGEYRRIYIQQEEIEENTIE